MIVNRTPMPTEANSQTDGHFSGRSSTRSYQELVSKKAVYAIKYQNMTKIYIFSYRYTKLKRGPGDRDYAKVS